MRQKKTILKAIEKAVKAMQLGLKAYEKSSDPKNWGGTEKLEAESARQAKIEEFNSDLVRADMVERGYIEDDNDGEKDYDGVIAYMKFREVTCTGHFWIFGDGNWS